MVMRKQTTNCSKLKRLNYHSNNYSGIVDLFYNNLSNANNQHNKLNWLIK